MADINQVITLGIGTPADIPHLTLFGLSPTGPVAAPELDAAEASLYAMRHRLTEREPRRATTRELVERRTIQGGSMMRPPLDGKTPTEKKDYGIDWAKYLPAGTTITDSQWDVPSGITKDDDDIDGQATVIRLTGGTAGTDYVLTNTIVTSAGEHLEQAIEVRVRSAADIAGI